jgi:hypothetical protein
MSVFPAQDTFVRGELSPRLHARASLDLYKAGLSRCENFLTLPHGGIRKRGGSYFVDEVPNSSRITRIIPFIFSVDQAYVLVLAHLKLRVYAYGARVGTVEVVTPWTEDEVFDVQYVSSADVMWMVHPNHAPRKLTRTAHTSWSLSTESYDDGPFASVNTVKTLKLSPDANTGTITITATGGNVFTADMVGSLVRIDLESYTVIPQWEPNGLLPIPTVNAKVRYEGRIYQTGTAYTATGTGHTYARMGTTPPTHIEGSELDAPLGLSETNVPTSNDVTYHGFSWTYLNSGYGVARITAYNSPTSVTATVTANFPSEQVGVASKLWRLGKLTDATNPNAVTLFEERLTYALRYSTYLSKTGQFDKFQTGPKADDALAFQLAGGGEASDIVWLRDIDGFLAIGTIGGVRSLSGAGIDEALTPSSFKNRQQRTTPCANILPINAGQTSLYVAKGRKALVELALGDQLRFRSEDLGQISDHIPKRGIVEIAFQAHPDPLVWFPLDTGELGCFTYQPSQDVRGMHRHVLGGNGIVESCAVTPGQTGLDDVWLLVRRTINGATKRFIEIITQPLEYVSDVTEAFAVDCGLSRPSGSLVNSVTGLSHLAHQTVDVLADVKVYRGLTVSGTGGVSLPGGATASVWSVGLPFEAGADTLELDVGGKDGSLIGRKKRVTKVILSLLETDLTGLQITSLIRNRWEQVKLQSLAPASTALYTGNVEVPIDDSWEGQGRIRIRHVNPTPCTIRALTPAFDAEP